MNKFDKKINNELNLDSLPKKKKKNQLNELKLYGPTCSQFGQMAKEKSRCGQISNHPWRVAFVV